MTIYLSYSYFTAGFPHGSAGKESTRSAGDLSSIPGLGRSPGEGKGYPLQYSGLENSMDCVPMGSKRVGHDWVTFTSLLYFTSSIWPSRSLCFCLTIVKQFLCFYSILASIWIFLFCSRVLCCFSNTKCKLHEGKVFISVCFINHYISQHLK